jgi:hypothetical protein
MRYTIIILLCLGSISASAQLYPETISYNMLAPNKELKLKKEYRYSFHIKEGRATSDSILIYKGFYDKKGHEIRYKAYDSTGRKEWSMKAYYHCDDSNRLLYDVERLYRHDDFVNYKKTLHRIDTTFYKLTDKHYYNNGSFERKTGKVIYDSNGELAIIEILDRGLHIADTNFYTEMKLYYSGSRPYCKDSYSDKWPGFIWSYYYTWDSVGNLAKLAMYEAGKMDNPKTETIFYYNQSGQLYRIESETFYRTYYDNPHAGFKGEVHVPVHYSYYYEYDRKGVCDKRTTYTNGILTEVLRCRYKYYK